MKPNAIKVLLCCGITFLPSIGTVAEARKIKIPEERVITNYLPEAISHSGDTVTTGLGSGPNGTFTAADLARQGIVSRSYPQTIKIMENVLAEIRRKSPNKDVNPKVQLFNGMRPEARAVNQDLIMVSVGFFKALEEEFPEDKELQAHALAFILAHEYAHLLFDHPKQYPATLKKTKISAAIAKSYQMMKAVQVTHVQFGGNNSEEFAKAEQVFMGAAVASPWIEAELFRLVYAPYTRDAEQLADFMASDLLSDPDDPSPKYDVKTGSTPLASFYEKYDNSVKKQLKDLSKDVQNTTKQATKEVIAAAPAAALSNTDLGAFAKGRFIFHFGILGIKKAMERLDTKKVHLYYSSDKRVEAIKTYTDKFYPPRPEGANAVLLAAINVGSTFAKENTANAAAQQAMALLAKGDVAGAEKALKSVSIAKGLTDINYLMASGDVAFAKGDMTKSIDLYRKVIRRSDSPVRAYRNLSKAHLRKGNDDKAVEALNIGMKKFSPRDYIVEKIGVQISIDRPEQALETLAKCHEIADEDLSKQCEEAAKPAMPQPEKEQKKGLPRIPFGGDGLLKKAGDIIN